MKGVWKRLASLRLPRLDYSWLLGLKKKGIEDKLLVVRRVREWYG